jgi:hypothetical protein
LILLDRSAPKVPYSDEALKATLERLQGEWDDYQSCRDRDGIYLYLTAVFDVAAWWLLEGRANEYARRALKMSGHAAEKSAEPFAADGRRMRCTLDRLPTSEFRLIKKVTATIIHTGPSKVRVLPSDR